MLTSNTVLTFAAGALFVCAITVCLSHFRRRRELRKDLDDDDRALQALYLRLKQAERSGPAVADSTVRSVRTSARRLLDMTVELLAKAATAARSQPGIGAEYERGAQATLGTIKGLLDCADALVAPMAYKQRDCAIRMLGQAKSLRDQVACQIERCRVVGYYLDEEASRLSMLEKGLLADEMLLDSDPLTVLGYLHKQIGVINEVIASFELKTARLPQA